MVYIGSYDDKFPFVHTSGFFFWFVETLRVNLREVYGIIYCLYVEMNLDKSVF